MSLARRGKPVHGVVLLDKPEGLSSNQALQTVRRLFDARKAGHTGSLDPFATGMLPLCLGEATKTAGFMLDADKAYRARMQLGQATETGDTEGRMIRELPLPRLAEAELREVLHSFIGEIEQLPPMYSALKHQGQPLYRLARAGKTVEREPRRVNIRDIELLEVDGATVSFEVHCSKGTYIRTLAEDIGATLGTCAHLVALRRLWVAPFKGEAMISLNALQSAAAANTLTENLLPLDAGLAAWPALELGPTMAERFVHGNPVPLEPAVSGQVRVQGPGGAPLGLGETDMAGMLHPRRVYHFDAE